MNESSPSQQSPAFLTLAVCLITSLILLINVSFKIINLQGLVFAANSLICPIIGGLYLLILRHCTFKEQRHLLNISLMTLYLFCIGVYILVNMPAAEYMNNNPVYQIIFDDIPKKFFATTIAFALSFYLPHLLFCTHTEQVLNSPRHCILLALLGGMGFFFIDFFLLFSSQHVHSFKQTFVDSLLINAVLLLLIGVSYLTFILGDSPLKRSAARYSASFPLYHYLVCFAVAVMLMCVACEYRIVALGRDNVISASSLFFPITLLISTLIGEVWGYKAHLKLVLVLILTQVVFDTLLMGLVALPSPRFFNLNPFYNYIMPRRLPAASLALLVTFISNAMLLRYLNYVELEFFRPLRIFIANTVANSLLCLVNYSLLFGGIYPYEQIVNLAVNVWEYKLLITILSLPLLIWLCKTLSKNNEMVLEMNT
ncbi:MAG: VUT family protein [Legionella sp.]|nr:MAG: VUT family protein [Legionella sp.]